MKRILLLTFIVFAICGCGTLSIKSTVPKNDKIQKGVAYATPMNVLTVDVTYVLRKKRRMVFGYVFERKGTVPRIIIKQVTITETLQPDPRNVFTIDVDEIVDAKFYSATLDFHFTEDGLIKTVANDVVDKKIEVIKQTVGAALTVAKIVAIAEQQVQDVDMLPKTVKPLGEEIVKIYNILAERDEKLAPPGTPPEKKAEEGAKQRKILLQNIVNLQNAIKNYLDNNKKNLVEISEEKHYKFTIPYDLSGFKQKSKGGKKDENQETCFSKTYNMASLVENLQKNEAPEIEVNFYIGEDDKKLAQMEIGKNLEGFVYRRPIPVRVQVIIKNVEKNLKETLSSIDTYFKMPQFSHFFHVPAKSKSLTKRKTDLTFSERTGNIIRFGSTTDSSAEKTAQAINEVLGDIQRALPEIRNAEREFETAVLESKKKLLDAERNYLNIKKELEELKKEINKPNE
jgi:hypothetical protein